MKKFILKSLIFIVPLILAYTLVYHLGYRPIISNSVAFDAKLYEINRVNLKQTDILAIGSSITLNNLSSSVIKDSLKRSYYNLGAWGLQVCDINQLIKGYVSLYKPKYILFPSSFGDFDMEPNSSLPGNLFVSIHLAPIYYIKNYTNYKDLVDREKSIEQCKKDVNGFTSLNFDQYGGTPLNINKQTIKTERVQFIDHLLQIFPNKYTTVDYRSLDSLAGFLKSQHIKLIFIQSPFADYYVKTNGKRAAILSYFNNCRTIIERNNGIYLNFENPGHFADSLFADPLHLNKNGAEVLTREIVQKLKPIIKT